MNDTSTHPATPEPSPFGAGIPIESVESVRLASGLSQGPALDVRGQTLAGPSLGDVASTTTTADALSPQPFVGWIIPATAATALTPPAPHVTAVPPLGPAASSAQFSPLPQPQSATPAFPPPYPAPTFASAPPPPNAPIPPPAGPPPAASMPLPPATKPPRRWWIAIAHLAYLIPFPPGVLITAAVWIWRRSRDPLMADQGREALNMQLTFWLAMGILSATCVVSPLVPFVYVLGAVLCILAAIAAWGGDRHRYPWVFRFLT